ncbi:hypothetical protein [Sphingobium estronivorans]|uniref:hypothetical protein n=1 Tax=Sphingobium estronivorans TaxID=1577690 RepID=UPI00123AECB5|nr:hypothetical protein [Sphingobium estronivorans]
MTWPIRLLSARNRLDVVAGLVDGILNALTLAAGRLLKGGGADLSLVARVGAATALTTLFVFFMAHYAEERAELTRAERELNLTSHGKLATSRLGRRAVAEALSGAVIAAMCGLVGATVSLLLCIWLPGPRWVGPIADIALLGVLGALLAKSFHGSVLFWTLAVMISGAVLTLVGIQLDIAS